MIKDDEISRTVIPATPGAKRIIAEADGTMIPIVDMTDVTADGETEDRRKTRKY